jgi:hypothetical protein
MIKRLMIEPIQIMGSPAARKRAFDIAVPPDERPSVTGA